jgi:cyanate permease
MFDGLKHALKNRSVWIYLAVMFVGMGVFNGVTTWIEGIVRTRGFSPEDAGNLGAAMLVGGLVGAVVIPPISDRQRNRRRFIVLGVGASIPGLLGLAFATSFALLAAASFVLGVFLVSTMPVGMQYVAELTRPTPEGTSSGLIQLCGQASVVFVYVMEAMKSADGSYTSSLVLAAVLLGVCAALATRLDEPVWR